MAAQTEVFELIDSEGDVFLFTRSALVDYLLGRDNGDLSGNSLRRWWYDADSDDWECG